MPAEPEKKSNRVPLMMSDSEMHALDEWRRLQPDLPGRAEALRRMLAIVTKAKKR